MLVNLTSDPNVLNRTPIFSLQFLQKYRITNFFPDGDSDSSVELLVKLEQERQQLREKRKREKDKLKMLETAEEKRARRLYKKDIKAKK